MPRDYYPRRQADIVTFTSNLSQQFSLDVEAYGLSIEQASAYTIPVANFASAWQLVKNKGENSSTAYAAKELARIALENATRPLVAIAQAHPATTNEMRIALNLPERKPRRKKIPTPDTAPELRIDEVNGRSIKLRLIDTATGKRKKAPNATSATIFFSTANTPPATITDWTYLMRTTRTLLTISLPAAIPPGEKVWLCAQWQSTRGAPSSTSQPISTHAQGGVSQPSERQRVTA